MTNPFLNPRAVTPDSGLNPLVRLFKPYVRKDPSESSAKGRLIQREERIRIARAEIAARKAAEAKEES